MAASAGAVPSCGFALSEHGAASVLQSRAQIGKIEAHKVRLVHDK
jgi:hypothetical protein